MFQVLSFSTAELSTAYVGAMLSVFIKAKGDFYGKRGHGLTLISFLKNAFVMSADTNFYLEV